MHIIILQTETIFFLFRIRRAVSPPILVTHYFFPSLKNAEKELRKFCRLETTSEYNNKKITITTVKNL